MKNYQSIKALTDFIHTVNDNDTLYRSFLDHKMSSQVQNTFLEKQIKSEHSVLAFQCFICENLHESTLSENNQRKSRNIYDCPIIYVSNKTTWHQHWDVGKCQAKALKTLLTKNVQYSNQYFDDVWKTFFLKKLC